MLDKPFYIYRHIRPDTDQVFYIGKGYRLSKSHGFRATQKHSRSKWWNRVIEKNNGVYTVEVIMEFDTEAECNAKEIELIKLYGRRDLKSGTLVNLTDGGDGSTGIVVSVETKSKLSKIFSGEGHPNFGKKLSSETCRKKSDSMVKSDKNLKGKKLPEWWRDKMRDSKIGNNNPMFGKTSPVAKQVIDIFTGKEYDSVCDAAKDTPYQFQYVSAMLNGVKPNKTTLKFKNGL